MGKIKIEIIIEFIKFFLVFGCFMLFLLFNPFIALAFTKLANYQELVILQVLNISQNEKDLL